MLLLRLNKGENDHGQDQVHKEKLTYYDYQDRVYSAEGWDVSVHQIAHIKVPGVLGDKLKNC
jgi:hypothetical protein